MKKNYFLNSQKLAHRENRKIPYENPTFFLGKLYQTLFLMYTVITLVVLNTAFGFIWTTPYPDEKDLFLKFPFSRNSKSSVWNTKFFPQKVY